MTVRELTPEEREAAERVREEAGTLYNAGQAAIALGVSRRTIMTYVKSGKLVGSKIAGRWQFTRESLLRCLRGEQ